MPQGSAPDGASTVLYIGGYGRSGSTVLDRVLGALPDVVSVGEIRSIWGAVLREDGSSSRAQRPDRMLRRHPLLDGDEIEEQGLGSV